MGSNVIGLDIGTNAVRAVELSFGRGRPTVRRMGQVGLVPGAVVAGEVMDPAAVSSALRRLWREAGFASRSVVVGVANSRVVARMTDLPLLPDDELRSSLPYQVQDLIPIPVEEAELDYQVVEHVTGEHGQPLVRVLLVAAHRDMLRSLLAALDGAGLSATRIDLIPFALIRALHVPGADSIGHEVIIGSGAGVTNVVVHEGGLPRFVRTLASGGAAVTEALALDLGIESDDAEALKRGYDDPTYAPDQPHVDQTARDSLLPLANEVAGSLDFHLAQVGHGDLQRVVVSGGAGRLLALRTVLQDQLGVHVVDGDPYAGLDLGKVPLDAALVAGSADLFAVAIGLALSAEPGRIDAGGISLLPSSVTAERAERRQLVLAGGGVAGLAVALLALTFLRGMQVHDVRADAHRAEDRAAALTTEVAALHDVEAVQSDITAGSQTVAGALRGDVAWTGLLRDVTAELPEDVWMRSFAASRVDGMVKVEATGFGQVAPAHWLQRMATVPALANPWLTSSALDVQDNKTVQFSTDATLTGAAGSDRLGTYTEAQP
ncbi:MAG: type pilus assembly protein PilM [Actinomycetia bacterium]|nr:type pilus assembly protein PilM [Actinomycetes bacterium]